MVQRPLWVDPSGLSPNEHDAYESTLERFGVEYRTASEAYQWLVPVLPSYDASREDEILSFFRTPPDRSQSSAGTLLALLRLLAHAPSSKHLTRDLVFLQTAPVALSDPPPSPSGSNPFRRPTLTSAPSNSSTLKATPPSPTARTIPAPPPFKRRPPSPAPSSSASWSNPFRGREPAVMPLSPPASMSSEPIASPPLPPRPSSKPKPASPARKATRSESGASSPVPPLPVRRASTAVLPPLPARDGASFVVVSSSSTAGPSTPLTPPPPAPKPRTKLTSSTHIGPSSTNLRSFPSPGAPTDSPVAQTRPSRSNSAVSASSGSHTFSYSSPEKPKKAPTGLGAGVWPSSASSGSGSDDVRSEPSRPHSTVAPLARARTLGSKPSPPPPPPKRRPESLLFQPQNPFSEPRPSPPTTHRRTPSLHSSGSSTRVAGAKIEALLGQSEDWLAKQREGILERRRVKNEGRQPLVGEGYRDDDDDDEDSDVRERRREIERSGVGGEDEGWSRLS